MDFAKRLTVIVHERSQRAVASVPAWCATEAIE